MMEHHERHLLKQLAKGDAEAFRELYQLHWENLYIKAYKRLSSPELSEEVVQQLFLDLWEKRKTMKIKSSLTAYLHGMLKKKILQHFRDQYLQDNHRQIIKIEHQDHDATLEQRIIHRDILERVDLLIQDLPTQSRRVFELSRKQWLSNSEIASKLRISNKAVEYHINYALRYLRNNCKEYALVALFIFWYS